MQEIRIVEWEERYAQAFIDLSIEWLEKYVSVEPGDLKIIHHPHEAVLNGGGNIFFAVCNERNEKDEKAEEKAVGTAAMIPAGENAFELAKLAVTQGYKGQKLGERLMERCLEFAREKGAERVILYTNHNLIPALGLYKKYGFEEVDLGQNKYIESDIKMELTL